MESLKLWLLCAFEELESKGQVDNSKSWLYEGISYIDLTFTRTLESYCLNDAPASITPPMSQKKTLASSDTGRC